MKKGMSTFQKDAKWPLGKDNSLSFWNDRWSNIGTPRSAIQGPFTQEEDRLRVRDVVSDWGGGGSSLKSLWSSPCLLN